MNRTSGARLCVTLLALMLVGSLSVSLVRAADPETRASVPSASGQEIATVGATQGDAKVQRAGEAQFKKIEAKAPLYLIDFLSTARVSKLWWKGSTGEAWSPFPEVTHGSLGENTIFGFAGFERAGPATTFVGQVNTGIVRFIKKLPETQPPSTFAVVTPTARIQVIPTDRAADFMVETVKESRTAITVLWGKVRLRNIAPQFKEERILTSCQEVDVEKDKEPGEVRWVSTDTMKNLIKRTTIPNTLPTDVPLCERLKTEVIERPGRVYVPPPGAVVVPIPIPLPPGKTEECPCPPGSYMNPETKECACCPPGKLYNRERCSCDCPCPPNTQYDPTAQRCVQCREGATYNSSTCGCACPCPQGQYLLPGTGCIPQCPEGYTPSYDTSSAVPHRCPVCVQQPVVKSERTSCGEDKPCGRCENCTQGNCVPKSCPEGLVLNRLNCECQPFITFRPGECRADSECPACQKCREGKCVATMTCSQRERLNLQTCQCESATTTLQSFTSTGAGPTECTSNRDCPRGEMCKQGKCVKRPPPKEEEEVVPMEQTFTPPRDTGQTEGPTLGPFGPFTPGFGIGIGGGGGGGGGRSPRGRPPGKAN